jgi:excisionase family DNA binding protein
MEKLLKVGEVAELMSVCRSTVRWWERRGWITSIRTPGGHRLFALSEVERLKNNPPRTSGVGKVRMTTIGDKGNDGLTIYAAYVPASSGEAILSGFNLVTANRSFHLTLEQATRLGTVFGPLLVFGDLESDQ